MSQPLPRFLRTDHAEWERKLASILLATGAEAPPTTTTRNLTARSAPGDEQRLRYIPVIAEGIGGTIPGTNPLAAVITTETRTSR